MSLDGTALAEDALHVVVTPEEVEGGDEEGGDEHVAEQLVGEDARRNFVQRALEDRRRRRRGAMRRRTILLLLEKGTQM